MDIVVVVTKILGVQKFTAKNGNEYTKYQFVGTTTDRYPKTICFSCLSDETWEKMGIAINNQYNVSFDLSSREYNGKYFTEVNAWKAVNMAAQPQQPQAPEPAYASQPQYNDNAPF